MTIDLRGSPLRGSIIIVHPLPRVHADLKGRLPPWANHKASPRDSRRKTGPTIVRPSALKAQNSGRDNCVNLPVCVSHRQAAQIALRPRTLNTYHARGYRLSPFGLKRQAGNRFRLCTLNTYEGLSAFSGGLRRAAFSGGRCHRFTGTIIACPTRGKRPPAPAYRSRVERCRTVGL